MVKRIILSTVILTLSLSPHQLQASTLRLISNFYQQSPVPDRPQFHPEIYPRGTFPDFRVAETPPPLESRPSDSGDSLGKPLFLPQYPALQADFTPRLAVPRLSPAPPPAKKANLSNRVMALVLKHLHTPYQRGGSLRTGRATDCSGFVKHIYQNFQIDLPHSSAHQARLGKVAARSMDFSKLQIGDLLFFAQAESSIGHVGIYLGEGKMAHASSRRRSVIITSLRLPYYAQKFVVAKRFAKLRKPH